MTTASQSATIETEHIDCPLCGGSDHRHVTSSPDNHWGIAGQFDVVACESCAHKFMNPRPTLAAIQDCYPTDYGPHLNPPTSVADDNQSQKAIRPWYLRLIPLRHVPGLKMLYEWMLDDRSQILPPPISASCRALEIGCAAGAFMQQLKLNGWNPTGVEPGTAPAKIAQAAGLDVIHGTLDNTEFDSEQFEFVCAWMVLEHTPDPKNVLSEIRRLLKPNGVFTFSVPNAGSWESTFFRSNWDGWELPRHLQHFTPRSITRLLDECGFNEIKIIHQRSVLNIIGSLGIMLTRRNPESRFGRWLRNFPHAPGAFARLALAPLAHALAFLRQGGRLTITCRK